MVKKLKALHKKITHMFYDNRAMVNKNIKRLVIEPIVEPLLKITGDKIVSDKIVSDKIVSDKIVSDKINTN